jgi:hypothetical protein
MHRIRRTVPGGGFPSMALGMKSSRVGGLVLTTR